MDVRVFYEVVVAGNGDFKVVKTTDNESIARDVAAGYRRNQESSVYLVRKTVESKNLVF